MHLIIDGKSQNQDLLTSVDSLKTWLIFTVNSIGMQVIGGPYVIKYPGNGSPGISGIAILAESNISVHTYPEYSYVFIDIFSCVDFNWKDARDRVKEDWKMKSMKIHLLNRRLEVI